MCFSKLREAVIIIIFLLIIIVRITNFRKKSFIIRQNKFLLNNKFMLTIFKDNMVGVIRNTLLKIYIILR